jgi:hypothetical protein
VTFLQHHFKAVRVNPTTKHRVKVVHTQWCSASFEYHSWKVVNNTRNVGEIKVE